MLADDQPVMVEDAPGILLYRDATLPTVYYYAATRPAIARGSDGYQLALVHYDRPVGDCAGMLSMVVNLQPEAEELGRAQRALSALADGADVQLVPLPWTAGTVAVAVIGGEPVRCVPSLMGDNSAALSISLSTSQYLLLRSRATHAVPPVYVVYGLSYDAFRPQYAFRIQVDESKFRDWMQKKCSANFFFISLEKSETFEELRQAAVLRVESENFTGEEPPLGFRLAFMRSLQSALVPLPRFAAPPQGGDGNWLVGFSCSTVRDLQSITRRLDTDMRLTGVVARKAFIQGELAGLAEALAQRGDQELPTGAHFVQSLTVRCHDSLQGKPLELLNARIQPAIAQGFHSFEHAGEQWLLKLPYEPGAGASYVCRCEFTFGGSRPPVQPVAIPISREQAYLDILPAAYFSFRRYSIETAEDFPWHLVSSVKLSLRGPGGLDFQPAQALLVQATPSAAVEAFCPARVDLDTVAFSARITPRARKGLPFDVDGAPAGAAVFLNPLRRRVVTFRAAPGSGWSDVARIEVVLTASAERPILWESDRLTLTPSAPSASLTYWYSGDKTLYYQVRYLGPGGPVMPPRPAASALPEVQLSIPEIVNQQ